MDKWKVEAKRVLKYEMRIRGVSNKELVRKLKDVVDIEETERSIVNKVTRGAFSAAFFLQCMRAMDVKTLDVSGDAVTSAKEGSQQVKD